MEYSLTFTIDNGVAQSADGSLLWNLADGSDSDYDEDDDVSIGNEQMVAPSYEDLQRSMMATIQRLREAYHGRVRGGDEGAAIFVPASGAAVAGLEKRAFNTAAEGRGTAITGCAICLENFEDGEELAVMPCSSGHEFHPDCIITWLGKSNTCPLCRYALPTDDIMHHDDDDDDDDDL